MRRLYNSSTAGLAVFPQMTIADMLLSCKRVIEGLRNAGVPVIHFGTDTAMLLDAMREAGSDVIGVDWRIPLDDAWHRIGPNVGIQGISIRGVVRPIAGNPAARG